jgi:hypothetical protein
LATARRFILEGGLEEGFVAALVGGLVGGLAGGLSAADLLAPIQEAI